tara:strand:- start:621 stop:962 length:342 start_codon:yes stop_codon:yes gene_type:complete
MGLFSFFKDVSGSLKNTEIYGAPIDYLSNVTEELDNISRSSRILANNPGRLKMEYNMTRFTLSIDFIYFADYIQVTIEVLKPNLGTEVFECNYDIDEIKNLVISSISYINNGV